MLFDYVKEHEKQNIIIDLLIDFRGRVSKDQRTAIMCSLFQIANSDGDFSMKEAEFFLQIAALSGYRLRRNCLDNFMILKPTNLIQILDTLTEGQKDWFTIAGNGMSHADGINIDIKDQYLNEILKKIGITEKRYKVTLKKIQIAMDFLN